MFVVFLFYFFNLLFKKIINNHQIAARTVWSLNSKLYLQAEQGLIFYAKFSSLSIPPLKTAPSPSSMQGCCRSVYTISSSTAELLEAGHCFLRYLTAS